MNYLIEGADYFIRYMQMPPKIYACVVGNSDGTFSIFLDPRRSRDQQLDDYIHEYAHLLFDDLYNGQPIYLVERRAS